MASSGFLLQSKAIHVTLTGDSKLDRDVNERSAVVLACGGLVTCPGSTQPIALSLLLSETT